MYQLPSAYYAELADLADADGQVPDWFGDATRRAWGIELAGRPIRDVLVVRAPSVLPVTYSRASWEINKGCNFSCEHCYLEQRPFAGLPLADKFRLLDMLRDMGVIWFEITGGEPLIDLVTEGPEGLLRLPEIADVQMMLRTGGCTGCKLSSTCRVCRPMARVYQEAKAPLSLDPPMNSVRVGVPEIEDALSGGRRESHPPAPTDPGVNLSAHRALVILITSQS